MKFTAGSPRAHLRALRGPLTALEADAPRVERWGRLAAEVMLGGGRLLAAGNGGSAAQAQHLTGELVGRFQAERLPLSALALHAETSTVTAVANDYGFDDIYSRQVRAHGRPGDMLVTLSTSGASPNVVAAAEAAREAEITTLAVTGPAPNSLCEVCDDALCVEAQSTATVQEVHLVFVHLLCAAIDAHVVELTAGHAASASL